MEVPHPCLNVIFEEVDDLAKALQESIWADGELHCSLFLGAGYLEDQPEHDTMCCEGSQTCKQCKCPKNRLHEARSEFEPRTGNEVEIAVKRAALQGRLPWDRGLPSHPPLFAQKRDPTSGRLRWFPTAACTPTVYEACRKRLGGVYLIENGLWRLPLYDYLAQAYKDTMHGQEHGVQM